MNLLRTCLTALVCVTMAGLPEDASAAGLARDYTLKLKTVSFRGTRGSCLEPALLYEGVPLFTVNTTLIPTTTESPLRTLPSGDQEGRFKAPFNGSLLNWGQNNFFFHVSTTGNNDYCTHSEDTVDLVSGDLSRRLFYITRNGQPFHGVAPLMMDLSEINPVLSRSIAELEDAVKAELYRLRQLSGQLDWARQQATQLEALQAELKQLLTRPLDSITSAELEALLARYSAVPSSVRSRLVQMLADLQASMDELRAEIDRINAIFRQHMEDLDGYVMPQPGGLDVHDPDTFEPDLGDDAVDEVEVPDVSQGDDFDETQDPYAAFAQQTLTELNKSLTNGVVTDRQGFQSMVRLWRFNQDVFERGLKSRVGVSLEEWGAFHSAQLDVLTVIRGFMGEGDWFLDSPVRANTKALVAYLEQRPENAAQAQALKNNLNLWYDDPPRTFEQKLVLDTLDALFGGYKSLDEGVANEDPSIFATLNNVLDGAVVATKAVVGIGLGFTPAGDFIDLCEVVTGKELCNPWGDDLTVGERMLSGAGLVIGSGTFWRNVSIAVSAGGIVAMAKLGDFLDNIKGLSKVDKEDIVRRLGEKAISRMDGMTSDQILKLLNWSIKDADLNTLAKRLNGKQLLALSEFTMEAKFLARMPAATQQLVKQQGTAVKSLQSVYKRTADEVRAELVGKGFGSPVRDASGNITSWVAQPFKKDGQEFWMHPDHSLVRIAERTVDHPYPHLKKEITNLPGVHDATNVLVKVTDNNKIVPATPGMDVKDVLVDWYCEVTTVSKQYIIDKEYALHDVMERIWAINTHLKL
ncbi:hypothetical protein [Myxococcus landrumensis]|uniref:Pre-toxin TG domain-containing protein n=1 Tax=Myxococcus landrumensis TaxID=2813577 RepID=A0ABX7MX56_9BACT|nr:hypothetical protein [Myxococcus landrumus]QSQ10976.1 hypothetical protein JY572_21375 [Myxococcus landrumus]